MIKQKVKESEDNDDEDVGHQEKVMLKKLQLFVKENIMKLKIVKIYHKIMHLFSECNWIKIVISLNFIYKCVCV